METAGCLAIRQPTSAFAVAKGITACQAACVSMRSETMVYLFRAARVARSWGSPCNKWCKIPEDIRQSYISSDPLGYTFVDFLLQKMMATSTCKCAQATTSQALECAAALIRRAAVLALKATSRLLCYFRHQTSRRNPFYSTERRHNPEQLLSAPSIFCDFHRHHSHHHNRGYAFSDSDAKSKTQ